MVAFPARFLVGPVVMISERVGPTTVFAYYDVVFSVFVYEQLDGPYAARTDVSYSLVPISDPIFLHQLALGAISRFRYGSLSRRGEAVQRIR